MRRLCTLLSAALALVGCNLSDSSQVGGSFLRSQGFAPAELETLTVALPTKEQNATFDVGNFTQVGSGLPYLGNLLGAQSSFSAWFRFSEDSTKNAIARGDLSDSGWLNPRVSFPLGSQVSVGSTSTLAFRVRMRVSTDSVAQTLLGATSPMVESGWVDTTITVRADSAVFAVPTALQATVRKNFRGNIGSNLGLFVRVDLPQSGAWLNMSKPVVLANRPVVDSNKMVQLSPDTVVVGSIGGHSAFASTSSGSDLQSLIGLPGWSTTRVAVIHSASIRDSLAKHWKLPKDSADWINLASIYDARIFFRSKPVQSVSASSYILLQSLQTTPIGTETVNLSSASAVTRTFPVINPTTTIWSRVKNRK